MYLHRPGEPQRSASRVNVRIAILTGVAVAVFSVVFLRLWYLQVLSGDKYRELANDNRVRQIRVQAPRGEVLDREGRVLVDNRGQMVLELNPRQLPPPGPRRRAALKSIERVIGMPPAEIRKRLREGVAEFPGGPVTLREGVGMRKVFYLRENKRRFRAVSVRRVFVREYRRGTLAAHLFGNVGEVTAEQLALPRYQGLEQGDMVGQSGIEYQYDRFLRGRPGATRINVDALGRPRGQLASRPAAAGHSVRLTIDSRLQRVGEGALGSFDLPGAFVAMNPASGEILAMGSAPSFDPGVFTRRITERQYRALTSEENDAPLANRAIQGLYPTGSSFKPVTAVAALEEDLIDAEEIVNDTGVLRVDVQELRNAGDAVFGPIDMSDALKVSSDIYFYKLGLQAPAEKGGGAIQDWARRLGLGERTGIDLPAETEGLVPTPAWRNRLYRDGLTDRPWRAGDNINLAVGQGDLQANPLQMAVAYSALANGGEVVRPHLGMRVESVTGEVLEEIDPANKRRIDLSEENRSAIMEGLTRAAMEEGGTSYPVFGNFPLDVAGKTGTAERGFTNEGVPIPDQSWYVAMAPAKSPKIVVAVTIERGGFGADAAAPVAARMLEAFFAIPPVEPIPVAEGQTRE